MILYRALRPEEIEAGNVLIPKSTKPFLAHPRLDQKLPFQLGETVDHAVREHQWDGEYPTRGVSCTTSLEVAKFYAHKHGIIVEIDEAACDRSRICRFLVKDHVPRELIFKPEDEEVILLCEADGPLPAEIVINVIKTNQYNERQ